MYCSDELVSRIKSEAKKQKIKLRDLLVSCDLGINALSQLSDKKGLSSVSLAKIADYLDCSVDYLLGRTDNPKAHLAPADLDFEAFDPADFVIASRVDIAAESKAAQ